jgi:hypothetical protein
MEETENRSFIEGRGNITRLPACVTILDSYVHLGLLHEVLWLHVLEEISETFYLILFIALDENAGLI